jgi:hypothetical protein
MWQEDDASGPRPENVGFFEHKVERGSSDFFQIKRTGLTDGCPGRANPSQILFHFRTLTGRSVLCFGSAFRCLIKQDH